MTNNELNVTATCIAALASQPNSEEKIKLLLQNLFASNAQKADFDAQKNTDSSVFFHRKKMANTIFFCCFIHFTFKKIIQTFW